MSVVEKLLAWPHLARIARPLPEVESWEVRDALCEIKRVNSPNKLKVFEHESLYLVVHTTANGDWIEHDEQRYRTSSRAIRRAEALSGAMIEAEFWHLRIDGEQFSPSTRWSPAIHQKLLREGASTRSIEMVRLAA